MEEKVLALGKIVPTSGLLVPKLEEKVPKSGLLVLTSGEKVPASGLLVPTLAKIVPTSGLKVPSAGLKIPCFHHKKCVMIIYPPCSGGKIEQKSQCYVQLYFEREIPHKGVIMAVKKASPAKKKTSGSTAKKSAAKAKSSPAKSKSAPAKKVTAKKLSALSTEPLEPASAYVHTVIDAVTVLLSQFQQNEGIDKQLTGQERMRLIGAGIRNWGFIEKAWDILRENQNFIPSNFSINEMSVNIANLEDFRQLYWLLEKFLAAVNECMLVSADAAFRDALRVYNNLKEQAKGKVPGAEVLYMALLRYFRRKRSPDGKEETEQQLERDFMKLVHGKADGKIEIVNERPVFSGGVHKVVDDVHKNKGSIQIKAEKEIEE